MVKQKQLHSLLQTVYLTAIKFKAVTPHSIPYNHIQKVMSQLLWEAGLHEAA